MKNIRILFIAIALMGTPFSTLPSVAQGQPSPDALQAAQKLVLLMSPNMIAQLSAQTTSQTWPILEAALRARYPSLSSEAINALRTEFQKLQDGYAAEMIKDAPPIYARFFTADELSELIKFYQTPTGAKTLRITPNVFAEFTAAFVQREPSMRERTSAAMNAILRVYGYVK